MRQLRPFSHHDSLASSIQERIETLAEILKLKIQPFVTGDKEGFRQAVREEAEVLRQTPFGVPMMHLIG